MESEVIFLGDSCGQSSRDAVKEILTQPSINKKIELNSEEFRRRRKALQRARRSNEVHPSSRPVNKKKASIITQPLPGDIVLLSSSDEEKINDDEAKRASSPSIVTEINQGSRAILELIKPTSSRPAVKRSRTEEPCLRKKRKTSNAPSIIIEEPETGNENAKIDLSRDSESVIRQSNNEGKQLKYGQTTSESLLSQLNHLQHRTSLGPSIGKSTSELFVERLKVSETKNQIVSEIVDITAEDTGTTSKKLENAEIVPEITFYNESNVDVSCAIEQFLKSCKELLPSPEFQSVEKKIRKYLSQISPQYLKSRDLSNLIELKWGLLDSEQDNVYIQVRDVLQELKSCRKEGRGGTTSDFSDSNISRKKVERAPSKPLRKAALGDETTAKKAAENVKSNLAKPSDRISEDCAKEANGGHSVGEQLTCPGPSEPNAPSRRHIRKLEKALVKCERQIKRLEETEIDFEEEDDSVYVLQAKYKKRFMDIYRKLASYNKLSANLDRRADKKFNFFESRFPAINAKITKYVNRTKQFPDFADIRLLVEEVNAAEKLDLVEVQIHTEAERIFQSVGRKLKSRRGNDDFDAMCSYFKESRPVDPAAIDPGLEKKLQIQEKEAKRKLDKVFEEFIDRQICSKSADKEESDCEVGDTIDGDTSSSGNDTDCDISKVDYSESEEEEVSNLNQSVDTADVHTELDNDEKVRKNIGDLFVDHGTNTPKTSKEDGPPEDEDDGESLGSVDTDDSAEDEYDTEDADDIEAVQDSTMPASPQSSKQNRTS